MAKCAGVFTKLVQPPHRGADSDPSNTQPRGDNRADGAAAAQIGAVRILLAGHAGFFADGHEARCRFGIGAVALVGVAFDHRAGIHQHPVARFVGCLLYTSDAADERSSVDLGGRRIIKKKKSRDR